MLISKIVKNVPSKSVFICLLQVLGRQLNIVFIWDKFLLEVQLVCLTSITSKIKKKQLYEYNLSGTYFCREDKYGLTKMSFVLTTISFLQKKKSAKNLLVDSSDGSIKRIT